MSVRDSKLRINVDVENAKRKARELSQDLVKMGNAGQRGGTAIKSGMVQASQGITQAADASAAAQIRFQTMTQGMLNLSTASIQTFTSISNLARAENRAKASTIAVSRAVDLLANKRERLNDLLKGGIASEQKLINIRREITTATDDLVVKTEKMEIETQAVLDIQLLFFASLTNVGVSSYQTITTMVSAHTKAMISNAVSTRFNSIAQFNNRNSLFGNAIARKLNSQVIMTSTGVVRISTLAVRLQTVALKALRIALGPIGLIFIGISAAMVAYETNALGLKDTINSLLGIQDDQTESMEEGAEAADAMAEGLAGVNQQLFKMPNSIASAVEQLERLRVKFRGVTTEALNTEIVIEGIGTAVKDFKSGDRPPADVLSRGGTLPFNVFGSLRGARLFLKKPPLVQAAAATSAQIQQGGKFSGGGVLQTEPDISRIVSQLGLTLDEFNTLDKIERELIIFKLVEEPLLQQALLDPSIIRQVKAEEALAKTLKFFRGGAEEDDFRIEGLIVKAKAKDVFNKKLEVLHRKVQLSSPRQMRIELNAAITEARKFGIPLASLLKPDLVKLFSAGKSVGNVINGVFFGTDKDAENFLFATLTAGNIGPTGTSTGRGLHPAAFGLTGNKLTATAFNKTFSGGISVGNTQRFGPTSTSPFLQDQSRLQQKGIIRPFGLSVAGSLSGDTDEILGSLGFGGVSDIGAVVQFAVANFNTSKQQQAFMIAFESSGSISQALSETHQFNQAQLKTLQNQKVRIAIEDRNRNKLRTGGTRVLDEGGIPLPLSDPAAVIGGFLSISKARVFWREQARRQASNDRSFLQALGIRNIVTAPGQIAKHAGRLAGPLRALLLRTGIGISFKPGAGAKNQALLELARLKGTLGTTLLGIDPRFVDAMTASFSLDELQLRAEAENKFINQTDIKLEENRQEIIKIRFIC